MKIKNEMEYRQYLERMTGIKEHINQLRAEQKGIHAAITGYQMSDIWLDNRGLELDDDQLVVGTATAELVSGKSRGSNAKHIKKVTLPRIHMAHDDLEYLLNTGKIDYETYETLRALCGFEAKWADGLAGTVERVKLGGFMDEVAADGVTLYGAGGEVIGREEEEKILTTEDTEDAAEYSATSGTLICDAGINKYTGGNQ